MTPARQSPAVPPDAGPPAAAALDQVAREAATARALIAGCRFDLILASSSPRRHELLGLLLPRHHVIPPDIEEVPRSDETPVAFAARVAREKAESVSNRHPGQWVCGADTVVTIDGAILGKPADASEATRMLRALSGRTHRVCTAIALAGTGASIEHRGVESEVTFRQIEPGEIEAYVATGEPFDKAGAYGLQGGGGRFVTRVAGSWSNVVGLPLVEVATMLLCRHGQLRRGRK